MVRASRRTKGDQPVGVVVAGGDRLVCELVTAVLDVDPRFRVVDADHPRFVPEALEVAVLGGRRLDADLLGHLERLQRVNPSVRAVLHVRGADVAARGEAERRGAVVLPQSASLQTLLAALTGQAVDVDQLWGATEVPAGGPLSRREHEVLVLLADGHNPDAIGRALRITTHTARDHVKSIRSKLGATSTLDAVMKAVHLGLVPGLDPT